MTGALNDTDWPAPEDLDIHIDGDDAPHGEGERTVIIRRDHDAAEHETDRRVERRIERRVVEGGDGDTVIIRRNREGFRTRRPDPAPPHPPVFMAMSAGAQEFDRNGDGALSQEEFRAQQLRYFDASDGNGDGRVRARRPCAGKWTCPSRPSRQPRLSRQLRQPRPARAGSPRAEQTFFGPPRIQAPGRPHQQIRHRKHKLQEPAVTKIFSLALAFAIFAPVAIAALSQAALIVA